MKIAVTILSLILIAGFATGQERERQMEPTEADRLAEAIQRLDEKVELVLTGSVKIREAPGDGSMASMLVVGSGAVAGEKFEGAVEIWRNEEGDTVMISRQTLPGFAHYDDGDRSITRLYFEKSKINTQTVVRDLGRFLDFNRLGRSVKKGEFEAETDAQTGQVTFRGEIPTRIVEGGGGSPYEMMAPQILRVEAVLTLDKGGEVGEMRFTVVRSDPFAQFKRQAMEGDIDGGVTITSGMPQTSSDEGDALVYTLKVSGESPSEEAEQFLEEVKTVMKKQIF